MRPPTCCSDDKKCQNWLWHLLTLAFNTAMRVLLVFRSCSSYCTDSPITIRDLQSQLHEEVMEVTTAISQEVTLTVSWVTWSWAASAIKPSLSLFNSIDKSVTMKAGRKQNMSAIKVTELVLPLLHPFNGLFSRTTCCLQCFDTVGWASGRASGL